MIPKILDPRSAGEWTTEAFRRPLFHELARHLDGYTELIEMGERLEAFVPPFAPADDSYFDSAAREILGGADADEQLEFAASRLAAAKMRREVVHEVVVRAESELNTRGVNWITWHADEVASTLTSRLLEILDEARAAVEGLGEVRSTDDLATHPDAAPAWAAFWAVVPEFSAAFELGEILARVSPRGMPWNEIWLIENYREVWPLYFLRHGMDLHDSSGRAFRTVEPLREPWAGMSRAELLRFLVDSRANVSVARDTTIRVAEIEKQAWVDQANFEAAEAREHADALIPNSGPLRVLVPRVSD